MKNYLLLLSIFLASCIKETKETVNPINEQLQLEYSDCLKDLNGYIASNIYTETIDYDYPKEERQKDTLKQQKFMYAVTISAYTEIIDSLYGMIPEIVMPGDEYHLADTTPYIHYVNSVDTSKLDSVRKDRNLISILYKLSDIQMKAKKVKLEIQNKRVGPKNEVIVCQLCNSDIKPGDLQNLNSFPEIFAYVEKEFNIVYRELNCSSFSISLLDKRKVAYKYKIRR